MALNYIPNERKKRRRKFPTEIKAFWGFLWRWALLYIPAWALLMVLYLSLK